MPKSTLPHTIEINYGGVASAKSPYRVYVSSPPDVSKIRVSGKWFDKKIKPNTPTNFQIDTRECEMAELKVNIVHNESAETIPIEIKNSNGIHTVNVIALIPGNYSTNIYYGGIPVPFNRNVFVAPIIDFSKVVVSDLTTGINYVGRLKEFTLDLSKTGAIIDSAKLSITIIDPNGNTVPHKLVTTDIFRISYTPHYMGCHKIHIMYDGTPIPASPFTVNVVTFCEPSRCKATGQGLVSGITGDVCKFTIETRDAGLGGLTLAIEGPSQTKLKCVDNKNGSCSVEYIPNEPGDYEITILFANTHIPGSPFKLSVTQPVRPDKVKVFGPAIDEKFINVGKPTFFNIDVSDAGPGLIAVTINNVNGIPVDNVMVVNKGGGLYTVNFIPPDENSIVVSVKFAHQHVGSR